MSTGLSAAGLLLTAGPATADDPVAQAQGRFLGGSVLGVGLDSLLAVFPAAATNVGAQSQVFQLNPLDLDLVNAIPISLGPVDLLGPNPILTLGAVGQYAEANADGSALAASGAVTDSGAIGVGGVGGVPVANAALNLSGLLDSGATGLVSELGLTVTSIAARAVQAAGAGGVAPGRGPTTSRI